MNKILISASRTDLVATEDGDTLITFWRDPDDGVVGLTVKRGRELREYQLDHYEDEWRLLAELFASAIGMDLAEEERVPPSETAKEILRTELGWVESDLPDWLEARRLRRDPEIIRLLTELTEAADAQDWEAVRRVGEAARDAAEKERAELRARLDRTEEEQEARQRQHQDRWSALTSKEPRVVHVSERPEYDPEPFGDLPEEETK